MHPILAKIDDLDAAIGNSADLQPEQASAHRASLDRFRATIESSLSNHPAPGSTTTVGGAAITHRPDLAYEREEECTRLGINVDDRSIHHQKRIRDLSPDEFETFKGFLAERARQAADQGEHGYLPVKERLAKDASSGGTIQAPEPSRPAEPAKIGMERR